MFKLLAVLGLLSWVNFSVIYAQQANDGDSNSNNPIDEIRYAFTCQTYLDDGYLLIANGSFGVKTKTGTLDVFIQDPDDSSKPDKLDINLDLTSQNTVSKNFNGQAGYSIEDYLEYAETKIQISFAKILTDNAGEIFINDESYEVNCTKKTGKFF